MFRSVALKENWAGGYFITAKPTDFNPVANFYFVTHYGKSVSQTALRVYMKLYCAHHDECPVLPIGTKTEHFNVIVIRAAAANNTRASTPVLSSMWLIRKQELLCLAFSSFNLWLALLWRMVQTGAGDTEEWCGWMDGWEDNLHADTKPQI